MNISIKNVSGGETTQSQDLGTYYDVFGNNPQETRLHQTYTSDDDILSDTEVDQMDNGTYNFGNQPVIFVRDPSDSTLLHFYTVVDNYGTLTVTVGGTIGSISYSNSVSQSIMQESFGDTITYLDQRIDSSDLLPVPTVPLGGTPPPIKQRSLLTKILIQIVKGNINPPLGLVRGVVEGFVGGAHSDYDGVTGVITLITSSAQRAAAFKALVTWNTYKQIPNAIVNAASEFMNSAEATAVTFQFGQSDFTDDATVRFYVGGYAAGYTTEQICVAMVGAGIASKVGTAAKVVVGSTSVGQRILTGVSDAAKVVQRIKALSVDFAINSAQKALRTEELAQAAARMADAVAKTPFGNGKTIGQVINSYVDRLDIIQDELAKIGQPLDDFGVKAQAQLAKLLDTDLGYFPGEKALRGFLQGTPEFVQRSGNVQLVYEALFKDDTGALDKAALVTDLEEITDSTVPFYIIGSADSPRVAWQINANNVIRSESDAITIALNNGVSIPDDVEVIFVPEGFCGPDVKAFYIGFSKEKNPTILWQDFYNNGKIKVKVDQGILNSDEGIVAVLGHEMYEINALRQIFASSSSAMQYMDLAKLIDAQLGGTIHQQAWDYADNLVLNMRPH